MRFLVWVVEGYRVRRETARVIIEKNGSKGCTRYQKDELRVKACGMEDQQLVRLDGSIYLHIIAQAEPTRSVRIGSCHLNTLSIASWTANTGPAL